MTTVTTTPMDGWNMLPWKQIERSVFKLQKRIYRAAQRDDRRTVHKLQRLLMKSRSAKLLAVRRVTQDNQGKRTAGVDGVKSLQPLQRLKLSDTLTITNKATPVRRVWIPKPGTNEQRGLGIPTIHDRALQSLVKAALEPEWEAKFEPNSYGFRPGRSCHDAIQAIFNTIRAKPKYVLDADIEKCFDRICHNELLKKVNTSPNLCRQLKTWLKAGVLDNGKLFPTAEGTMQGSPLSPLLANIALHGLEEVIAEKFPRKGSCFMPPIVVRYADDLVGLHADLDVIKQCEEATNEWLKPIGLRLKPSKTRITHTLTVEEGEPGFDFLGYNIRQYPVGKTKSGRSNHGTLLGFKTLIKPSKTAIKRHTQRLREIVDTHKHADQAGLIKSLNPVIIGWTNYYSTVVSKVVFSVIGRSLRRMLYAWTTRHHPNKGKRWMARKYWRHAEGRGRKFQPTESGAKLYQHHETPIRRHVKVQGASSPYDGNWVYWSSRLGRHPEVLTKVATLLKKQKGKCLECGLFFKNEDVIEIDHIIPKTAGGRDAYYNRQLLHRHCHDVKTSRDQEMPAE